MQVASGALAKQVLTLQLPGVPSIAWHSRMHRRHVPSMFTEAPNSTFTCVSLCAQRSLHIGWDPFQAAAPLWARPAQCHTDHLRAHVPHTPQVQ